MLAEIGSFLVVGLMVGIIFGVIYFANHKDKECDVCVSHSFEYLHGIVDDKEPPEHDCLNVPNNGTT